MMVVADMPSDYGTYDQDKEQVKGQALSARDEEPEEVEKEVAIKVTLPTIFVMHVQNMLNRRGVAMDDFILELLTRFVPSVMVNAADRPENRDTKEDPSEMETIA